MAAIAEWIRLHLPSVSSGFKYQAQQLRFFNLLLNDDVNRTKINKERPGLVYITQSRETKRVSKSVCSCENSSCA